MWSQFVGLEGVIDKQKLFLFLRRLSINHAAIDRGNFLSDLEFVELPAAGLRSVDP